MIAPIVRKEILGSGRHGRTFAIRGAYLVLLACLTVPALLDQVDRMRTSATFTVSKMGQEFTIAFGILQFVLVVLLAPAFSIGTLASERATGTLDLLHVAGVRASQVVAGKYAARMATLLLFMISGVPLLMAGTLMGGVGMETILLVFAHCMIAGALGSALGFTISGGMRQTVPALVLCYLALSALYVGFPLALVFYDQIIPNTRLDDDWFGWVNPIAAIVLRSEGRITPALAWAMTLPQIVLAFLVLLPSLRFAAPEETSDTEPSLAASLVAAGAGAVVVLGGGSWMCGLSLPSLLLLPMHAVLAGALAWLLVHASTYAFSRIWQRVAFSIVMIGVFWLGPAVLLSWFMPGYPAVEGAELVSPVITILAIEQGARLYPAALLNLGLPAVVVLAGLLLVIRKNVRLANDARAVVAVGGRNDPEAKRAAPRAIGRSASVYGNPIAWRDARSARRGLAARLLRWCYLGLGGLVVLGAVIAAFDHNGYNRDEFGQIAIVLLVIGGGLVALVVGSGSIAEERERRAMPLLVLSRLTAVDILFGKLWGLAVYLWPVMLLPAIVAALFFLKRDPAALGLTILLTAGLLYASASIGLLYSSFMRKTAGAAGAAIGTALVYCIVPVMIVEYLNWHDVQDFLAIVNPLVTIIELVEDFGRRVNSRSSDFWLAVTGIFYLWIAGTACLVFAWATLQTRQEIH